MTRFKVKAPVNIVKLSNRLTKTVQRITGNKALQVEVGCDSGVPGVAVHYRARIISRRIRVQTHSVRYINKLVEQIKEQAYILKEQDHVI